MIAVDTITFPFLVSSAYTCCINRAAANTNREEKGGGVVLDKGMCGWIWLAD